MMLNISRMLTEYKANPVGMDEACPRFCYTLSGSAKKQMTRRIVVTDTVSGKMVWDSGVVHCQETTQIQYAGAPLTPMTPYRWQLFVTDDAGNTASAEGAFETGMMGSAWQAQWIAGRTASANCLPVQRTGCTFKLDEVPANARICISALGLYEAKINGKPVTEDCLTPGWTDYYDRVQYQVYDVSSLLQPGENTLTIDLAEGWYTGKICRIWNGHKPTWGEHPMLIAEVRSGDKVLAATDDTWTFTETTTVLSDIYTGETVDHRVGYFFSHPVTVCHPAV